MGASPFTLFVTPKVVPSLNGAFMCHNVKISLAVVWTMSAYVALASLADAAVQRFTDEAGVVIYTIDDAGIVSMFESRPGTDITLSVTRGTREQMQPQITEITPQEVSAGTSTTLKIQGKNLIGATVKFSVPGIDVSPYLTKPRSLDLPVRVAANAPPGEVVLELSTPIGKTQATIKVTELKIGSDSPVRREGIGKHQTISTTAPTSCPEGMVGVAAETGGFCIEIDRSYSGDIRKAERACAMAGKRLCQAVEWQHACEEARSNGLGLKNITGEWEWTGSYAKYDVQVQTGERDLSDELKSVLLGKSDCQTQYLYPSWRSGPYPGRCCK
jgi:quinohemoprotein amine dehydrogenase alpha subunit-like protein